MRWLLLKDLQILRRSPLLVALLVIYPIVLAVLIGVAFSRGPDKPAVAFLNQIPAAAKTVHLGAEEIDTARYERDLFKSIDPVAVSSRAAAIEKVRRGEVLAALIIPADLTQKLESGLEPPEVEVFYNAEDPVKARFVRDTINSRVQDANAALAKRYTEIASGYLDLIAGGGELKILGRDFTVLGLRRSEEILRRVQTDLPPGSPLGAQLEGVRRFAHVARENLDLSDDVLASVATPVRVRHEIVKGAATGLNSYAVAIAVTFSLMFVTLLLAAGMLALEREENAFARIVRGLVTMTSLLVEKVILAASCSTAVMLAMLAGLSLFIDLDWSRSPLWVVAIASAALAFASMGTAIGALTRDLRAASLLAFMVALPVAFVSLVPTGTVSAGLYGGIRVASALFPFRATLTAVDASLNDSGGLGAALLHLGALAAAFALAARVALRRFA